MYCGCLDCDKCCDSQSVPILYNPFGEDIFCNIRSRPLLIPHEAVLSYVICGDLGKENNSYFTITAFHIAVERYKVYSSFSLLQTAPGPSADPHSTCSLDLSPALLLFYGHLYIVQDRWYENGRTCIGCVLLEHSCLLFNKVACR